MSECRYNGRTEPRVVPGRHTGECADDTCRGCQPCERAHCRVCGIAHDAGTCPECMAETREALREIGRLCDALPEEVEHRGVEGEAMFLLGPATDPEAWGHREASARAGRIPADYLLDARDESHPAWVLGTWSMTWRAELEHDEDGGYDLAETVGYLDRNMGYMATWPHAPFEDFARDLRKCVVHLEAVLHDSDQGVRANVPCFDCGGDLERKLGKAGFDDTYTCRRCRRVYTIAEYNFALRASLEDATKETA